MNKLLCIALIICIFAAGYAAAEQTAYEKKAIKFVDTIYDDRSFTIKKAYDENSNKIIYIGIGCSVSAVDASNIKEMYVPTNDSDVNVTVTNDSTFKTISVKDNKVVYNNKTYNLMP